MFFKTQDQHVAGTQGASQSTAEEEEEEEEEEHTVLDKLGNFLHFK